MIKQASIFDPNPRMDAQESAFFARELEHVKAATYDVKFKQLKAFDLFPISSEAGNAATEITVRQFTKVGFAKVIQDYATDFPSVDTYGTEQTYKIVSVGDKYGWSIQEIRQSQRTNKRLDQRRAEAARRAIDEVINTIALNGDAKTGQNGFINFPGISSYTVLADGTSSSKTWLSKTPDQILRDITGIVNQVVVPTAGREQPDTLLLPLAQYNDISTRRVSTQSDTTVLEYLLRTSPYIKKVEWLLELAGAGVGATDRMMVYCNDSQHLSLEIPQMFEQFDPNLVGASWQIPCHARVGGMIIYYPLSVAYGDGI